MKQQNEAFNQETINLGWDQLQQNTIENLRAKSFGEANLNIKQMMAFAADDNSKWEYIRMALVSMPNDLAEGLVDLALEKSFIKNNRPEQFAFVRVLTQIEAYEKSMVLLNDLIDQEQTVEYVYWRARLHLLMKQEAKAEIDYLWLLDKAPKNTDYLSQYVTLLNFLGRNDEAMALLVDNEGDVDLLFRQIILLVQQDQDDSAKEKLTQLKALTNEAELTVEQKLEIGELSYWLEDYDYAMSLLQSVKSGEHINKAKLLMANVLVKQQQYDRAAVMYHQVQNGPEVHAIPAYQLEIELYREQGDMDAALKTADAALQMFKKDPDILYSRALLHAQNNNIPAVEADLNEILSQNPDNADAMNALGYSWADNDMKLDLAYDYIMRAHELKPNDKAILDSVGWIYYKKGELEKAEKYLRMAIENNTRDTESYQHLITVLEAQGDSIGADEIRKKALELFPSFTD
ncbi:tetratricopeptide repeat protein [Marinicella marina]|uniref:tetratricopeptide repeat protein n=1 Tax=Marinicella marina TaxID=2996016 RepID=UPI002260DCB7|nr:tetratricopeptide repeat protein [Marinicella marina]MDJ1141178.1 tetratricopeptide repeat protein [Marinicella marina]